MTTDVEVMKYMVEAIKDERKRISEYAYRFQKTVSQFATSNECAAYNQALRDFADNIVEDD